MKTNGKKKSVGKILGRIAIAVVAVAAILFVVLEFAAGPIVKNAAKAAGPSVLGTEIAITNADIHLVSGKIDLGGVVVGPPEGYEANLFEMGVLKIDIDTMSLVRTGGPIVIREIIVEGPVVTYELKGLKSNLAAILDKLGADKEEEAKKEKDESGEGRKVVIEHFKFADGKVRLALLNSDAAAIPIPLPDIELRDIGSKNGGVTGLEATFQVVESIVTGTLKAVAGVIGDVGELAIDGAKAVGSAAVDGAKAVGGAAVSGAKAVGGAAVSGVKAIGNLFSKDDDGEKEDGADDGADDASADGKADGKAEDKAEDKAAEEAP